MPSPRHSLGGSARVAPMRRRFTRYLPNLPEMVVDEGSVLFGMTALGVEKPVAGFSLPMEFRTESSTRALLFTQQREASVAAADS